jgi:phosphoglycerol transferase MdoB-like AlkP superfamily enzyme
MIAIPAGLLVYNALNLFEIRTRNRFDPMLVVDHWREVGRPQTTMVVMALFSEWDLFLLAGCSVIVCARLAFKPLDTLPRQRLVLSFWAAVAYAAVAAGAPWNAEQIAVAAHRALQAWRAQVAVGSGSGATAGARVDQYPYANTNTLHANLFTPFRARPCVFMVLMESFRGDFVGRTTGGGRAYVPFFDDLARKGLYCNRCYANAAYTIKAQESILGGLLPTDVAEVNRYWGQTRVLGLPAIMRAHGYETMFFQAADDITFDNTDQVMARLGFETIADSGKYRGTTNAGPYRGWGLQDDSFFRCVFSDVDRKLEQTPGKPLFVVFATISNHVPFEGAAAELFNRPRNGQQVFANSLHAADGYLRTFWEQLSRRPALANTIVVLTGDHGYPTGEHGCCINTGFPYNELFRVPLLFLWPGRIPPRV